MKILLIFILTAIQTHADDYRMLVDGAGCRTRQLAIEKLFEGMPGVRDVTILPREEAPKDNQRYFLIRSTNPIPSSEQVSKALGRRAKYCHVISVTPEPQQDTQCSP